MIRSAACALLVLFLTGCTTFALTGSVDRTRVDDQGDLRVERIIGLLAAPTFNGNTVVILPVWKSSHLVSVRGGGVANMPPSVTRWVEQSAAAGQAQP